MLRNIPCPRTLTQGCKVSSLPVYKVHQDIEKTFSILTLDTNAVCTETPSFSPEKHICPSKNPKVLLPAIIWDSVRLSATLLEIMAVTSLGRARKLIEFKTEEIL